MQKTEGNRTIIQVSHDAETWIRHGDEMMFKGDYAGAVQQYDKALESEPEYNRVWHNKANALEALGKYEEALACYNQALKCDENDAECWFNKGITLKKLGRTKDGGACIETGVHIAMGSG
jgi:tetratricopeptide (TPR) repeat protein